MCSLVRHAKDGRCRGETSGPEGRFHRLADRFQRPRTESNQAGASPGKRHACRPGVQGGLVITTSTDTGPVARKIPVNSLRVAVITPDFQFFTHQARAALPRQVPFQDAVFNLARTALTVEALRSEDYALLAVAMQDRLHQPYRLGRIPGAEQALQAALDTGAAGVALSGAGPSLIAFGPGPLEPVCQAMESAFRSAGLSSKSAILGVAHQGAQISSDIPHSFDGE